MTLEKSDQVSRRPPLKLDRAPAGARPSCHAVPPGPALVVRFPHGAASGDDEMPSVVLYEICAARPIFRVADVEYRTDRFPAMVGAAIDLDLDPPVAGRPHALGVVDGERRGRVIVTAGQHEVDRP